MNPSHNYNNLTPLITCIKLENYKLLELLLTRGAYYVYKNYMNNLFGKITEQGQQQSNNNQTQYIIKNIDEDGNVKEDKVNSNCVVKLDECQNKKMVEYVKWLRCRSWLFFCHLQFKNLVDEQNTKAQQFGKLVFNKNSSLIRSYLVGEQQKDEVPQNIEQETQQENNQQN
ncbi:hypothetical protein PPERSA_09998 [Pseudocohnilembus persalinus]|uniref:Uncharacterized protein n=1 Tax=Pseudocohnilembus persalinus TaxID=266149 RepID=A0A0V0QJD9_PSEPJ|nr:hypothetical protein PPERSA_09998 [Pseudocohnilembus persalinus]|eukprot:KRX02381.1 hypothetical protein PPERSA_09998 [Pseudocohnilembus persalinus]